jgi:hypothetical protein
MAKTLHPRWPAANVEAVCKVLASTDWPGLPTGSQGAVSRAVARGKPVAAPVVIAR